MRDAAAAREENPLAIVLRTADLGQDSASFSRGVIRRSDGSADNNVSGAGGDGLRRSHDPGLIPVVGAYRSNARSDDGEIPVQLLSQLHGLPGRSYDSVAAVSEGQCCETKNLILDPAVDAQLIQIVVVEAGEDGDRQNHQAGTGRAGGVSGGAQHPAAARSVYGKHADAELRSLTHGGGDGVGDIVIFQVEEDPAPGSYQVPHQLRALSSIKLHTDLVAESGVADGRHNFLCGGRGRDIEGNDQMLAGIAHQSGV